MKADSLGTWSIILLFACSGIRAAEECSAVQQHDGASVPDCNCKFNSVDYAVRHFISPIMSNLTTKAFFRYFKVDLSSPCPFWSETAQCMMEGCSVCTCDENEIPRPWLETEAKKSKKKAEYGWITAPSAELELGGTSAEEDLGRISVASGEDAVLRLDSMYRERDAGNGQNVEVSIVSASGIQSEPEAFSEEDDEPDEWTILHSDSRKPKRATTRNLPDFASAYGYGALFEPLDTAEEVVSDAAYVNLLENPERFTGYSGPSAQRVWRSIQQENCFGEISDTCLEKRIFYRLMSGLQASISTHIARKYRHPDGTWGTNHPLYWRAVGDYPDRLNNMYFTFLFLLRAVVRAQETIRAYPYNTGHEQEDRAVTELLEKLLASSHAPSREAPRGGSGSGGSGGSFFDVASSETVADRTTPLAESNLKQLLRSDIDEGAMVAVEECRYGFNESDLFQVSATLKGPQYWNTLAEKQELRDEFMTKFRNISRIMDCVTCEKCRVWGKLQILGIGTAIKILLHPMDKIITPSATVSKSDAGATDSAASCDILETKRSSRITLNRQEIIALMNTLNNLANSLQFAADAAELAQRTDLPQEEVVFASVVGGAPAAVGATEASSRQQPLPWSAIGFMSVGYLAPLLLFAAVVLKTMGKRTEGQ